ncbi:MAG TPA: hypothetical protein VFN38_10665 [Gemmatimonadaceae bacterium]|nr:hypothetical protein [Gemmatimonadaceae bacterium]
MRPPRFLLLLAGGLMIAAPARAQTAPAAAPTAADRPRLAQLPADSLERARRFTTWLYTNQTDSLFANMDTTGQRDMKGPQGWEETVAALAMRAGSEEQLIAERWVTRLGKRQYWRTAKFSGMPDPFLVRWVIVAPGVIAGLGLGPASQAPPVDP